MTPDPLFSEHWYRVGELKPQLASDVIVRRHSYRGIPSYVLHRRSTAAYHRVDAHVFELIATLDGIVTVDSAWQRAIEAQGEDAPSQPQVLGLLSELHEAELLTVNRRLDAEQLFSRSEDVARRDARQRYLSPLFLRFALFDPDRLLNALTPLARGLFNRTALLVWISLMLLAAFVLLPQWEVLRYEIAGFDALSVGSIGLFILLYPALKLLHELGHALAVKRLGGEVHELGIALMVFLPIPYVDASASAIFPSKWDRMLVSSAGILVELAIAAVAALLWTVSSGIVHDAALLLLLVGGLSTLLINGNPLLKFDGYYILSDALEIPNLAERSRRYVTGLAGRRLFNAQSNAVRPVDRAERRWLILYGVLATIYRMAILAAIALMVSDRFFVLGVALALWILASMVAMPIWRFVRFVSNERTLSRSRVVVVTGALAATILATTVWLPLPLSTVAEGVVWLPDNAIVRAQNRCEITRILARSGQIVVPGDPLFECKDDQLMHERAVTQARLDEVAAERAGLDLSARVEHDRMGHDLVTLSARLARTDEKIADQLIMAESKGRFHAADDMLLEGRFLAPGDMAAYIVPEGSRTVRVAITQADATWYRRDDTDIELQFLEQAGRRKVYRSAVQRETPQATLQLPSAGLTTHGGGRIVADPVGDGRASLVPVFDVELTWPTDAPPVNVGSHVIVVFHHDPRPLLDRVLTKAQRAFQVRYES